MLRTRENLYLSRRMTASACREVRRKERKEFKFIRRRKYVKTAQRCRDEIHKIEAGKGDRQAGIVNKGLLTGIGEVSGEDKLRPKTRRGGNKLAQMRRALCRKRFKKAAL